MRGDVRARRRRDRRAARRAPSRPTGRPSMRSATTSSAPVVGEDARHVRARAMRGVPTLPGAAGGDPEIEHAGVGAGDPAEPRSIGAVLVATPPLDVRGVDPAREMMRKKGGDGARVARSRESAQGIRQPVPPLGSAAARRGRRGPRGPRASAMRISIRMRVAARRGHELSGVLEQAPGHAMQSPYRVRPHREVRELASGRAAGHVTAPGRRGRTRGALCQPCARTTRGGTLGGRWWRTDVGPGRRRCWHFPQKSACQDGARRRASACRARGPC